MGSNPTAPIGNFLYKKYMAKKNQYYKLIEHIQKENIAKVFNFKTNKVEVYLTVLTKEEKRLQQQRRLNNKAVKKKKKEKKINKNNPVYLMYKSLNYYFNLYLIYKRHKLPKNPLLDSLVLNRYLKTVKTSRYSDNLLVRLNFFYLKNKLKYSFLKYNQHKGYHLNIISVYIILRRSNIYVTVVKDNKIARIFSPCLFSHIPKRGKKKSMSFFYTVKRTIMYITRFFFNKQKKYFLKIFFKGFQKFRRPLLSRFFFNKRLKSRCIGIHNVDFESFNGCRLRKSKRLQIRGQRKQRKKFSF